ncbi:NTP pyrophosphatase, house-cleaning of non-canonical NTPs [Paractinoplanes atraurantiacus]|uniref:NTP pyrophosphatase, house-cleaning of non-canonical NTPs n=2 Tax=Paractinoplanes atraurantiacus TaxID=1036182 RepID=A0A285H4B4_9ACTN|nr:NTP pyrophosphatase, house-cleaning of non-canonical NTPs [Actinoplanes atraurantiacus]
MQERALAIAALYDRHNLAAGRGTWGPEQFMTGFVGDVGDLAKLVMAAEGRRGDQEGDVRDNLGHELADCLWSVLVLARHYDVDLVTEFQRMTDGIERYLESGRS